MPIHQAHKKHLRQTKKRTLQNRVLKGRLKDARKRAGELAENKDKSKDLDKEIKEIISVIDRSVQKGVIHKNTASRYKSRFLKAVK